MAVEQPKPFELTLVGPTGPYRLSFERDRDEGRFNVLIGARATFWHVEVCERTEDGWRLAGMTRETKDLWEDTYWFEMHTGTNTRVEYCLQGVVRTDTPVELGA